MLKPLDVFEGLVGFEKAKHDVFIVVRLSVVLDGLNVGFDVQVYTIHVVAVLLEGNVLESHLVVTSSERVRRVRVLDHVVQEEYRVLLEGRKLAKDALVVSGG